MDVQKLEKAIEMAKNDAKILADPSSKLYQILMRKLKHVLRNAEEDKREEEKENDKKAALEPIEKAKSRVTKTTEHIRRQQKPPLQPKPIAQKGAAKVQVVDNIIKNKASVAFVPRQSSTLKSPSAKKLYTPPQPAVKAQPTKKMLSHKQSTSFTDFIVPKLDSPNPTRTGLVQKPKKSDLESMRQESDNRLKIAMKHLIIARKKALAEEKLKKEKRNKYSNVKSKIGLPNSNAAINSELIKEATPVLGSPEKLDINKNFSHSPSTVRNNGNIEDISMIHPIYDEKSANADDSEIQTGTRKYGGYENGHGTNTNNLNTLKPKPKPVLKNNLSNNVNTADKFKRNKKPASLPSVNSPITKVLPTSKSNSSANVTSKLNSNSVKSEDGDQLIQKVLRALETKLDPMIEQVQRHWENAAAQIDEKIAHALEKHDEVNQEPLLVDMEEPSMLVESETQYFQVTNAKAESPEPTAQIMQENEADEVGEEDAIFIQSEIKFVEKEPVLVPYQRTVLALPAYVIEEIIQDQSRKQKWRDLYYGTGFDSASAIESIGDELIDEIIDTVVTEIEGVSDEYLRALLQSELF